MGFFKSMLGKITGAENKESQSNQMTIPFPLEFATSQQGDWTMILSVNCENMDIEYNDGRKTSLMIASVSNGNGDDTFLVEDTDYIAFEIEQGMEMNKKLLQKMVSYYLQDKVNRQNQECVYVGEVNDNLQDSSRRKSPGIEIYVNTEISERVKATKGNLKQRQSQQQQKYQQAEAERQSKVNDEFERRLKIDTEKENEQKQARKQNPYINNPVMYKGNDGKQYFEYDGINTQTGEFLRIRNLNKVCKDATGRYLYTGYIQTTPHDYDSEMGMSPICFTIDKRVSDIVQENNPVEIRNFLNLLSQEENFKGKAGEMKYIGALDREGNILKNDNSQILWEKVQRVKQEYSQNYQRGVNREFE